MDLSNLAQILEGFKALATNKGFNLPEAQRRAEICAACPHFSKEGKIKEALNMPTCKKCGCVIPAKVKSMSSSCPIGKWKEFKDASES